MIEKQIEELNGLVEWFKKTNNVGGRVVLDAIDTIQALSAKLSASNLNNGWILCSERLPEKSDTYLITQIRYSVDTEKILFKETTFAEFDATEGKWRRAKFLKVVAWQPLPQAYDD